ncbi:hypothetical protein M9Y10_033443 [Tritrichomonas musculus]|uniref:Protein kinase domain-containing protein n=1 Tax=Tritrichomonas musculus TaxID=1915356 RepID=A0ABR2KCB5_9EUKA
MNSKVRNLDDFLLDINELQSIEIMLEAEHVKIFKSNYRNNVLLIHSFPIIAFSSSDLSKFILFMLSNSNQLANSFLRTYGIGFDSSNVYIAYSNDDYNDSNFQKVKIESLQDEEKMKIFINIVQMLKILDIFGFSYNNLKFSSIFYDAHGHLKFGCFLPYPIITLNSEDIKIFYQKEKLDVFMFGILSIELFSNKAQTEVLDNFWLFDPVKYPYIPENMPFIDLIKSCIYLAPSMRPTISDIYNQVIQAYPSYTIDETKINRNIINEIELIDIYQKFLEISNKNENSKYNAQMFNVLLGSYYIEKNDRRLALPYFQKSLASPISMNNIALLLLKRDTNNALELFTEAAVQYNYVIAQKNLAQIYLKGVEKPNPNNNSNEQKNIYLIDKNEEKHIHFLKMAADQGDAESIGTYMQYLRKHQDLNYRKYALEGSYKGDQKCLIILQSSFDEGYAGLEENPKASKTIAEAAAHMGNKVMMNYYSEWLKHDGEYESAFKFILENAEKGSPVAQLKVSLYYLNGIGVQKNEKEAAKWMKKASDYGLVEAMFNYATMLRDGTGVEKDLPAAEALCILASRKREIKIMQQDKFGYIEGEFHLPTPYMYFLGYPEEDEGSESW